jgi:hypothetical protein
MTLSPQEIDDKIAELTQAIELRGNELVRADPAAQNLLGQRKVYATMKEAQNGQVDKKSSKLEKVP